MKGESAKRTGANYDQAVGSYFFYKVIVMKKKRNKMIIRFHNGKQVGEVLNHG